MRHDLVSTLDLNTGDHVMRHGSSALVQVAEITEPRHPAMPGLVVHAHYYRPDERRYSEHTRPIHTIAPTVPGWIRVPDDALPTMPDERFDVPDGMHAWRYDDEITIRQIRLIGEAWPTNARGMTAVARDYARDHDMHVTCLSSSIFGTGPREVWERRYRLA